MLQAPPIRVPKIILFTNYTDEEFTHTWDSVATIIKSGESVYLEDYKAELFAKHLVDRELNKKNLTTRHQTREAMIKKCFSGEPIITEKGKTNEEILKLNRQTEDNLKKKQGELDNLKKAIIKEKEGLKELRQEIKLTKKI